ncbi:MAG: isopeptide-forming domain-containing fimbrial protein [Eubacteriales bacterium]|nr:isopeptide-forming domain-containing fimbrial protein [Eubacteriales bacterium]
MAKIKRTFRAVLSLLLGICLSVSWVPAAYAIVPTGIDMAEVFNSWVNYPGSSVGVGYAAGWQYSGGVLSTSENVGFTGYYHPQITDLTTGVFQFAMQSSDTDPLGFAWGIQKRANGTYSFYAYEECGHHKWSISYISNWNPSASTALHQGPVYHSTIDAKDYQYDAHNGGKGSVGFATGTVLAYGNLSSSYPGTKHTVKLVVEQSTVTAYINDSQIATANTTVQAGSFGPFSCSNANAHFSSVYVTSTNPTALVAKFQYTKDGAKTNTIKLGDTVSLTDQSTTTAPSLSAWSWTVTKDGTQVYSDTTPYTQYNQAAGRYVTTLQVLNSYGFWSNEYSDTLDVTYYDPVPTITKSVVNLTDPGQPSQVNDVLKYTVQVNNTLANSLWKGVNITDLIPAGLTLDTASIKLTPSGGTQQSVAATAYNSTTRALTVPLGDVLGVKQYTLTFEAAVNSTAVTAGNTDIGSTAQATGNNPGGAAVAVQAAAVYPNAADTPANDGVLYGDPDPAITKSAVNLTDPGQPSQVNDVLKYTIVVNNRQDGSMWSGVNVADVLPAGLTLDTASIKLTPQGGTEQSVAATAYNAASRTLTIPLGDVEGVKQYTITFSATVNNAALLAAADIGNAAHARGSNPSGTEVAVHTSTIYANLNSTCVFY